MLAFIMAIIGGAALAAGWVFEKDTLLFVALAFSGSGLLLFCGHAWLRWRPAQRKAEQSASDEHSSEQPSPDSSLPDESAEVCAAQR